MDKEIKRRILLNTLIYIVLAILLLWLTFFSNYTIGNLRNFLPYLPDRLASTRLSVILFPLFVSLTIFYTATIFSGVFEGAFNEILVGSLYAAGFASFFALFLIYSPGSKMLNSAGYYFLAAFAALLVYNSLAAISRSRDIHGIKAVAASATIYIEGKIALQLLSLFLSSTGASSSWAVGGPLYELFDLGVMVAAAITLLAIFKTSRNPYLSAVGSIASNYILIVSASLVGSLYFNYFRGRLASISPGIAGLSPYIEWTAICIVAALIFTRTRRSMQTTVMAETQLGEWMKHLQEIRTYKGDRFVGITEMISNFIEYGSRAPLLVRLALFLHENMVADEEITIILSDLINYEDAKEPFFTLSGRTFALKKENEDRRKKVLRKTIGRILPAGVGGSTAQNSPEENSEDILKDGAKVGSEESSPSIDSSISSLNVKGVQDES